MNNVKIISIIASILILVGIIGSIFTFKSVDPKQIAEEKVIDSNHFTIINVSTDNAKIEMVATDDPKATVELTGKIPENLKYNFSADVKGDTLSIKFKETHRKLINFNFFSTSISLKVYVPKKIYDSIQLESNNGRINVEEVEASDIISKSNNGRIELVNIKGTNVTALADNGRIEVNNVKSSNLKVTTKNGKIILDGVEGTIVGESNNGSITLITNDLERSVDLETDNGSIKIETDNEPINVQFDTKVDNGKVNILGHSDRKLLFGNGEHIIKLSTSNGSINVTK